MTFIWFLIILILLLIILLAIIPLKVLLSLDDNLNYYLYITWLKQVLTMLITEENHHIILAIRLFKKQIYKKQLMKKAHKQSHKHLGLNVLKQIRPTYVGIRTSYGFADPSITGFVYLVIYLISTYFSIDELYNKADFNEETSHINFNCLLKINIIETLWRFITSYKASHTEASYGH